jgi:hypothetical protein
MFDIPNEVLATLIFVYERDKATGKKDDAAMANAVEAAGQMICTCGHPLDIGVVHRKNNPCFLYTVGNT